jgi:hypothetical protein
LLIVEVTQIVVHKGDEPNPIADLFDAVTRCYEQMFRLSMMGADSKQAKGLFDIQWRQALMEMLLEPGN